ncbi:MAG: hypothetical protein WBA00_08355 [Rhodococcus sp. (in: high G+C Gram-positive bacteria)]
MAKPLAFTPPTPPDTAASDELDDLVDALHDSGLLRAFAGAARSYPSLLKILLDGVDGDSLRSLIALAGVLRDLDPEDSERVAAGIRQARQESYAAATRAPEGPIKLARRLFDPNTRRGISAALAALAAVGEALREGTKQ